MEYFGDSQWRQVLTTVLQASDHLKSEYRLQSSTDTRVQIHVRVRSHRIEFVRDPVRTLVRVENPLFESVSADLWSLPNFDFNFTKDLVRVFDNLTVNSNHDIYTVIIGVMLWNWRKLKVKKT